MFSGAPSGAASVLGDSDVAALFGLEMAEPTRDGAAAVPKPPEKAEGRVRRPAKASKAPAEVKKPPGKKKNPPPVPSTGRVPKGVEVRPRKKGAQRRSHAAA